ncbi:MAG: TatD family hydrolase [Sulfolobales archaeon]
MRTLVDSHVHLHEYGEGWTRYCSGDYILLAVSDDTSSSVKTVELSKKCEFVIAAVGVHPWNVGQIDINSMLDSIEELVIKHDVLFLGEVGLDKAFHPETFELQIKVFEGFLKLARDYGLGLSVHAAGAWRDTLNLLKEYKVRAAVFHWYTGPLELVNEIVSEGYFIGINPALLIQKKHVLVLERTPIEFILTESDGPYNYRGLTLGPELLEALLKRISEVKSMEIEKVSEQVSRNFQKLVSLVTH